ncbi:HipA domain-containing protein [uncultured Eubacterium sp.]|uniref:HipA domain-containing protein n=1 Tax=uncultured Eubacterium sp. TaxID=165185 RepID=UPI0025CBFD38|nr:HipA domain-containing protein [uncultured Eubacterium sp.]
MNYTFMHQNLPVTELELDDASGFIIKINNVYRPEHLPVGVSVRKGVVDRAAFNHWWTDRSIPASRSGVREALETLEIADTKMLLVRCFGLSLSDQYWIKPENTTLTWEQVNFFDNDFSDDMGDVLFGSPKKKPEFDFSSPDNTSDGCLKKRWKIINGKRCLIKGGSNPFRQQPFNEVIASEVMKRLGVKHIPYKVVWSEGAPYSICEDFITKDTELVSAWRLMQTQKKDNSTSVYQHFVNCCEGTGINVVSDLDRMIVVDYLIANEDRHLNNFGLIRNAKNLEWMGFAPIFDSGSSLGYDKMSGEIRAERGIVCKPFKRHHEEQLKLVRFYDWIPFENLVDVKEMICEVLSDEQAQEFMDERRIMATADSVENRIQKLKKTAVDVSGKTVNINAQNSTQDDVEKNIAEDYIRCEMTPPI